MSQAPRRPSTSANLNLPPQAMPRRWGNPRYAECFLRLLRLQISDHKHLYQEGEVAFLFHCRFFMGSPLCSTQNSSFSTIASASFRTRFFSASSVAASIFCGHIRYMVGPLVVSENGDIIRSGTGITADSNPMKRENIATLMTGNGSTSVVYHSRFSLSIRSCRQSILPKPH
jgi:hypothetical protein